MKIMLPVDGSPAALAAVRHALHLRERGLAASFVLVNVQESASLYEVVLAHDSDVLTDIKRAAGVDLLAAAEALLDASGADYEVEVAAGEPATLLPELIENYGADAVFIGASGVAAAGASAVGSVALALLQHSPVPVTVVRGVDTGADALHVGVELGGASLA